MSLCKLQLSTVTPVFHGESFLRELVQELDAVGNAWSREGCPVSLTEAIFVDDGSIDHSASVLAELQTQYPWVKVIQLSRNFGQHPATVAGILHSCGEWVATLDEDLQHPPKELLSLLSHAIGGGLDVVYGNAKAGVHESRFRDIGSRLYKVLLSTLSGNPQVRKFNSFRMLRGTVARAAAAVSTQETYFDVALCWFTNRIGSLLLVLKDRRYIAQGKSGYGLLSLLHHARRMLVTSEVKLLRVGALLGFTALVTSSAMALFIIFSKVFFPETIAVPGWTTLVVWILFFGGLTSFLHGIALEYMSIILRHIQGKPTFLVIDRSKDRILLEWMERRVPHDPAQRS